MSSEMALSGLASGFDWQPVVEQLIELEAIPQKRLRYEKQQNEDKISELGRLKGQLNALKSASTALQNKDLFEARKGALDEDARKFLGVKLDPASMTGSYKIEVVSLGSPTIMSSKLRKPNGLGSALYEDGTDPAGLKPVDIALTDLPLQTPITTGTFTIAGRSFEITTLNEKLSELIARVSSDFEEDGTAVSLEYNPVTDKLIVDGGQLTTDPTYTDTPILGSPTDSSNFLKVVRLLDQVSTTRDADYEASSGISIWSGALSVLTSPETKAWIRPDDPDVNPGAADSHLFVAAGGVNGTDLLYRRKGKEALYNSSTAYTDGQTVYKQGNLYKIKAGKNLASTAYSQGVTPSANGTVVYYGSGANQGFWELQLDLETAKQDVYTPASHDPTGGTAYLQNDIAKISDGVGDHFFRAVQDRTEAGAVEWSAAQLTGGGGIKSMNDADAGNWTNNRPNSIKINGKLYTPTPLPGGKIVFGIPTVHAGSGDDTVYSTDQMVVGVDGVAGVEDKYFKASSLWAAITPHSGNGETTKYAVNNVVQNANDTNFYKAKAVWTGVKDHAGANDQTLYLQNDYIRETAVPNAYFKATAAWANVGTHTGAADVTNSTTNDVVWRNMTGNKYFYEAKQDFASIANAATKKKYDDNAASIADKIVKNGSNFYQAKATVWDNITAHAEGNAVSGVSPNDVVQLSNGAAQDRFYKALSDLSLIAAHDAKVNYKSSETLDKKIVVNGGNYFQAAADRAQDTFNAAGAGLTSGQIGGTGLNQRVLDTVAGKTFAAKDNLALIQAHDAKVNYEPALGLGSEVVENGGQFYKFTHGDGKLAKHAFGASGLSAANAMGMAVGERALDNVAGDAFSAKALLGTINSHVATTNYAQNALIESGGDFFKAKLTNLAEATFTLPGGISSADLGNAANGDHLIDSGNGRVFSAQMALKDTINHQADTSYDPASGTLNNKLRTVGGLAGSFYKPSQVINFNNGFIDISSYATTTSIVKEGGQYYQFSEAYAGRGGIATANPGEWVKSPTDNVFYKNTSAGALSTDPVLVPAGWTSSTGSETTLAGMVAQGEMAADVTTFVTNPSAGGNTLWTDVTNDVTKPSNGGNAYWTHETNATTPGVNQPGGNAYWEKITDDVTKPAFGVANDFWTDEPLATTLGNNTFWTEVTNDVIKPTASTDYWNDVTAAVANFGDPAYWTNVTDAVSLDNQTLAGGDTAFWQDITDELVDFPAGPLISTYWDDITSDISLTTPPPAAGSNAYWTDVTADLTDKTDPDFFATWWTNATAEVTDESDPLFSNWWDDVTTDLTDLTNVGGAADLTDDYWTDITTEITDQNDPNFGNYWTEYAHLNGTTADPVFTATASGYDPNYWQMIDPGMKRLVNNGTDDVVATNAVDHTIWAKAGNLSASAGDDAKFGTHDTNEDAIKPTAAVGTWTGLGTYAIGDLVKGSDSKYYQARIASNSGSSADPTAAAGHDKWNLVGDSTKNDSFAYAFQYADSKFWEQVNLPEPGVGVNWNDYWETLSETVLASSQPLGSVDLRDKISTANFDGFSAANFPAGLGSFFIGDGTGAVRIDYDTANDSVSDLIARVNASEANVTMFYDPVGDRFVVQNNADGAIGINLHEDPDWDTLSANKGSGNILELMGLASPQDTSKYAVYSDSNGYSPGDLVKTIVGGSTTYWQATGSIAPLAGDTPDVASSNWEQLGLGAGRAMTQELGNNYAIRINDGELIYNNSATFDDTVHGYKGIDVNVSKGNVGDTGTFKVEHDIAPVQNAVSKLVEEFNDAQDYLKSVVSVTREGDDITAGIFSKNIEISRLGSQLRKLVFGGSYAHSESGISDDGTSITVDTKAILDALDDPGELNLGAADAGYQVKVKADETKGGIVNYYEWDGSSWGEYSPQFTSFRLENIGLDFGTGSNRVKVKDSSKLAEELNANPEKVKALFAEATATADDKNTGKANRQYQGITYDLNDFLQNFLSGDSDTGYKGAYKAHIDSLRAQNKRIDDRVEDMDRYLEQREKTLSASFIRMEEMQSKLNTQLLTLTNSFAKKSS